MDITIVEVPRKNGVTTNFMEGGKLVGQQTGEFVTMITQWGLQLRNVGQMPKDEVAEHLRTACR